MDFVTNEKLTIVGAAGMIGSNMAQTALMMRLTHVCAERNALFAAVGAGKRKLRALALVTQKLPGAAFNSPCGACRQVMSEFLAPDAPLLIAVLDGKKRTVYRKLLRDVMPFPFEKFSEK